VSYLNEARLKSQNVWLEYRKCLRVTFPQYFPVWKSLPAVAIDEEGEVRVAK